MRRYCLELLAAATLVGTMFAFLIWKARWVIVIVTMIVFAARLQGFFG